MNIKRRKETIEKLADIEHQRWSDWQRYIMTESFKFVKVDRKTGIATFEIPMEWWNGWLRQINIDYEDLTEEEKEFDREQVRRYIHLIDN